jgi:hypothetical protein
MIRRSLSILILLLALTASIAPAQQTSEAGFVSLLGEDTIAVEHMTMTPNELRAAVVVRSPRTTLRAYTMSFDGAGMPTSMRMTMHDPAAGLDSPPTLEQTVEFGDASIRIETTGGSNPGSATVEGGGDVLPFIDMVHWPYELMLRRAHAHAADSLNIPLLSGRRTVPFMVRRVAPGGYKVTHPSRGTMTVNVGEDGQLVQLDAAQTTRALLVTRAGAVDVEALAADFAAREAAGHGIGELSGRGETIATIGGANIVVDYGRPAKRGRDIYGGLVDFGEVWRTGANRATHFSTDQDLMMGETHIPAGTYTLFSIPGPDTWTLIISRDTDIGGTSYDPDADFARIEIQTRELPEVVEDFTIAVEPADGGGVLRFLWDSTEAYVPISAGGHAGH